MPAWLRPLLLCLLAIALPLQGVAALRLQHCAPTHERMAAAGPAHAHGPDQAHAHEHEHGHAHAAGPDAAGDRAHPADAGGSCSACAACCHALGPLAAPMHVAAPLPEHFVQAGPPVPVPPFLTGGPERPPRTILV